MQYLKKQNLRKSFTLLYISLVFIEVLVLSCLTEKLKCKLFYIVNDFVLYVV